MLTLGNQLKSTLVPFRYEFMSDTVIKFSDVQSKGKQKKRL